MDEMRRLGALTFQRFDGLKLHEALPSRVPRSGFAPPLLLGHKNLSVTDLSGPGGSQDCFDHPLGRDRRKRRSQISLLGRNRRIFGAAINFAVTFSAGEPFTSLSVIPSTPTSRDASFTASVLKGLTIASIFFTGQTRAVRET